MLHRSVPAAIAVLSLLAFVLAGCGQKSLRKEDPASGKPKEDARMPAAAAAAEQRERAARLNQEIASAMQKERGAPEDASSKIQPVKKTEAGNELEKTLVARKTPGIEGEVLESNLIKDIHFDFDKYEIRPRDAAILQENAALLAKAPGYKIQIEGHCDDRGTFEYNLALGHRRADSARSYLASLGIQKERISTISYGEEMPVDRSQTEEARARNRRAHIVVLPK